MGGGRKHFILCINLDFQILSFLTDFQRKNRPKFTIILLQPLNFINDFCPLKFNLIHSFTCLVVFFFAYFYVAFKLFYSFIVYHSFLFVTVFLSFCILVFLLQYLSIFGRLVFLLKVFCVFKSFFFTSYLSASCFLGFFFLSNNLMQS